ncbi:hypothetical protein JDN41_02040 [Rhodomicrobium udaipurense]|uniref:Uncharacterized protein n=1 Tax=Rhodomicrobium udaipurense TaxID=1202716 RepID=A0A8I1KJ14_9HYPH|nr:hypothetical protein [Rhodomicrobium udaipurense]MBJ7542334.1 hypothetical protein [Rhodomicrobium udaipurense]
MSLSMLAAASVALGRGLASGHDVVAPGPVIVWNGGSDIKMQSERLYEVCCHREWSYRDAGAQMNLLWRGNFELRGPLHPQLMALANAARDRRASAIVLEPLLRLLYRADGGSGDPKAWRVMPMPPCSPSIARQKRRAGSNLICELSRGSTDDELERCPSVAAAGFPRLPAGPRHTKTASRGRLSA